MRRAVFFGMFLACGAPEPAHVEIAQPLPTVTATASATAPPVARVEEPQVSDVRDPRNAHRSPQLVRTEAQLLDQLLSAMAANAPDRPAVLHRLAEAWVELRKSGEPGAGAKAIAYYKDLVTAFPAYAKIDEATYYLALENELAGDRTNARRWYFDVLKNSPSSRFVPYAYYAFGEIFYDEAKSDASKWPLAVQSYMEAVKYPSPISTAAHCRLDQARRHETHATDCGGT